MDVALVRRRLRGAIEKARTEAAARRARKTEAARGYDEFLDRARPVFHQFAAALAAEGQRFKVLTPAGSVRLSFEAAPETGIELTLDDNVDPPQVIGRTTIGRGRRKVSAERPVREGAAPATLSEEDVLSFLLDEILPFVER
jgi:hypothetical protein